MRNRRTDATCADVDRSQTLDGVAARAPQRRTAGAVSVPSPGLGGRPDSMRESLEVAIRHAAEGGDAKAQVQLARRFGQGQRVYRHDCMAFRWTSG
jgi:hypothetical protein